VPSLILATPKNVGNTKNKHSKRAQKRRKENISYIYSIEGTLPFMPLHNTIQQEHKNNDSD